MRLVLLRHGESEKNVLDMVNSDPSIDLPLTGKGRLQARAAAELLGDERIERILASPIPRAMETAQIVGERMGIPVEVDFRLREPSNGIFEGKSGAEYHARVSDRVRQTPEGGESAQAILARMLAVLEDLQHKGTGSALLVSHGDPLCLLTQHLRGRQLRLWTPRAPVEGYPEVAVPIILAV